MSSQIGDYSSGNMAAVTPHDSTLLSGVTRYLYVGGAGNVTVLTEDGQTVLLTAIAVGVLHKIRVRRVNATGTSATAIVAMF